jgi:hypothetical protein
VFPVKILTSITLASSALNKAEFCKSAPVVLSFFLVAALGLLLVPTAKSISPATTCNLTGLSAPSIFFTTILSRFFGSL